MKGEKFGVFYFQLNVTTDKNGKFLQSSYCTRYHHRIESVSFAARSFDASVN
jgi:hypothetical protein